MTRGRASEGRRGLKTRCKMARRKDSNCEATRAFDRERKRLAAMADRRHKRAAEIAAAARRNPPRMAAGITIERLMAGR